MLVQPNRQMLGDSHLDAAENLAKLKEGNRAITDRQKIAGQAELEKSQRAGGPRMPFQELVRRIQNLNHKIKVVDGSEGNVAIYVLKTNQELAESRLEDEGDQTRYAWHKAFKYVSGLPKEPLPEYAMVTVDERGIAKRELRGWRSVLISLIKAKALSYRQAVEEFGEALGSRNNRWNEQLQQYRAGFAG
jgi:hypothetical protein